MPSAIAMLGTGDVPVWVAYALMLEFVVGLGRWGCGC